MLSFFILVGGLVMLILGGGLLVRGASAIASGLGVSPMLVGLTIVGFGTSAPELVVNVVGVSAGQTGLAFGNVVGSNITNVALVLGLAALLMPITIQGVVVRREVPLLLLVTAITMVMALDGWLESRLPVIGLIDSIVLMLLFCIFLYTNVMDAMRDRASDPLASDIEANPMVATSNISRFRWLYALGGIALLFFGGQLTVTGAVDLGSLLGVPPTIMGLFVVAIGTSMPELVTTVIAAARGESDLALGNVVGSNLFNTLVVLPVSGSIRPIPVPAGGATDLLVSLLFVAILVPIFFLGEARLGRLSGVALLAAYMVYAGLRFGGG